MKQAGIVCTAVLILGAILSISRSDALPVSPAAIRAAADSNEIVVEARARGRASARRSARRAPSVAKRPRTWPVTAWAWKPYFGTVVAGVTLGTIVAVTTAGAAPPAPAAHVCWYWTDQSLLKGYWSYC